MKHSSRKIGLIALVAAIYAMVAGGPFGLEEIVAGNGYARATAILCLTPLVWAAPAALMVSELASALPETGGFYIWVRRALGPFWGFQECWLSFAGSVFDMAIYPIFFASYLAHLMPALGLGSRPMLIGGLMIAACVAMNLLGTEPVADGSIFLSLLVLAPFALLVWHGARTPHSTAAMVPLGRHDALGGILLAMWNYMGWDNASTIAGDVHQARRTYSRAMLVSVLVVVATYVLPILAMARAGVPPAAWETGSWVTLAARFGGEPLALAMTAAAVVASLSTFNALVLSLSRLPYAMARDGFLPQLFTRENRWGAPWVAIVVCAFFWGCAMGLGFERTVMLDVLLTGLSILLEFAALIALRIREPELPRAFRIPGGAAGLALVSVPPAVLIVLSCVRNRAERIGSVNSLAVGMGLVAMGMVLYWFGKRRKMALAGAAAASAAAETDELEG